MAASTSETLLCLPTRFERDRLEQIAPDVFGGGCWRGVEVVGFGPIAAAARIAALVQERPPGEVLLVGIAGSYLGEEAVGTALTFGSVALEGVGAGEAESFIAPDAMGFPQWDGGSDGAAVFERLELPSPGPELLTVCAASGSAAMVERRRERFPGAVAEDMEAFGAALACTMAGVPLSVVRGLSNVAGDRNVREWRVDAALKAAAETLRERLR